MVRLIDPLGPQGRPAFWVFAPIADLAAYFTAVGAGLPRERAQIIGFAFCAAWILAPLLRGRAPPGARAAGSGHVLYLLALAALTLIVRSGIFGLLGTVWAWPAPAPILVTALASALLLRAGCAHGAADSRWRLAAGPGWRESAWGLIACAWLLRLAYCSQIELLPEEAYYWNYSRHLDIGYLDHPPMVAWLIGAGTALFGQNELGVRCGALGCALLASFFAFRLTRNLFGEAAALVAVLLMQTLPFFFLTGLLMTPDAPLTAAWAAELYFLERALIGGRGRAWWGVGLALGLGLLSKYTIALLAAAGFLFMLLDARARTWFRRPQPYGAALLALLVFCPVILWNAEHEWASFVFQTSRRLAERHRFALHNLIASAIVLLTPTGFAAAAALLGTRAPLKEGDPSIERQRGWRLLEAAIGLPLAVFALFSLFHEVKLDWTGAPWVAVVPALSFGIVAAAQGRIGGLPARLARTWMPTLVAALLLYGAGFYYLAFGIPGVGYGGHPELAPVGWRALGTAIHRLADEASATPAGAVLLIGMDRDAVASELAFYAPDREKSVRNTSSAHLFGQVGLMYERWFPPAAQRGRTLLLVAWNPKELDGPQIGRHVERLGPIEDGVLMRDGAFVRRYYYRFAYGYLPGAE